MRLPVPRFRRCARLSRAPAPWQVLTVSQWAQLIDGARVLVFEAGSGKVFLLADGRVVKMLRPRGWGGWRARRHARRFLRAAEGLKRRGVRTVEVTGAYRLPRGRCAVAYGFLEGRTVRQILADGELDEAARGRLIEQVVRLMARLHGLGVYFRGLHLGNILRTPEGDLALIDVTDTRFRRAALGLWWRVRNFRSLLRYPQDLAALRHYGLERLLAHYCRAVGLDGPAARRLESAIAFRYVHGGNGRRRWPLPFDGRGALTTIVPLCRP